MESLGITGLQPTFSKIQQRAHPDSIVFLVYVVPLSVQLAVEWLAHHTPTAPQGHTNDPNK